MNRYILTTRFGEEIASDVMYVEELAACLYQAPNISVLAGDLLYLAAVASHMADALEAEDD